MGQEEQDMYHDYLTQGEEKHQATGKYSPILKVEKADRVENAVEITFTGFQRVTDKAFLVTVLDVEAKQYLDEWFPKKLCSNLDLESNTFYCWDVFVKDKKPYLMSAVPATTAPSKEET